MQSIFEYNYLLNYFLLNYSFFQKVLQMKLIFVLNGKSHFMMVVLVVI